jgi:hypothetical protein
MKPEQVIDLYETLRNQLQWMKDISVRVEALVRTLTLSEEVAREYQSNLEAAQQGELVQQVGLIIEEIDSRLRELRLDWDPPVPPRVN